MLRAEYPDMRMITLTAFDGDEDIRRGLAAGVNAYLAKDDMNHELVKTIRLVYGGQSYLPSSITARLTAQPGGHDLNRREIEVLHLIERGFARIAVDTAKNHVSLVLNELGVEGRAKAMTVAIQRGSFICDQSLQIGVQCEEKTSI